MKYDIIVVGGGHAGCEASLASARMGNKTLLVTGNIKNIADSLPTTTYTFEHDATGNYILKSVTIK